MSALDRALAPWQVPAVRIISGQLWSTDDTMCSSCAGASVRWYKDAVRPVRAAQRQAAIPAAAAAEAPAKEGPIILDGQVLHSIEPHRLDIVNSMEKDGWVERELMKMLKPVESSWQPADHLPDPASDTFLDEVCYCFGPYPRSACGTEAACLKQLMALCSRCCDAPGTVLFFR